jgi:crotonobetainyl-CoA:carnitine CoA-transferase CaiB-like acyl-CoA transferase
LFKALSTAIGHPEWNDDPRFTDNPARVQHQRVLYAMIDGTIASQTTGHWITCLEAAGVPCSAVNNLAEMLAHPQTKALGLVQDVPGTDMRFIGLPLSFDGQRPQPLSAPPKLGEHTSLYIKRQPV